MRNILCVIVAITLSGCASPPIRTKWADKNMRVMIDPDSLSADDYIAVQTALVKEGRFMVVDRSSGYKAIKAEQERLHRVEADRYEDKEKWAHWGKMYGVGAIVVGHSQCVRTTKLFSFNPNVYQCKQFLSLVDANSGEVISAVEGLAENPVQGNNFGSESFSKSMDWSRTVADFVDAYPKDYKPQYYSEGVLKYQELSKEEAQRQKEIRSGASVGEK